VIRHEWNALVPGDRVRVHADSDDGMRLDDGVVTAVEPGPGSNEISIRVKPRGRRAEVVKPRRLSVHQEVSGPDESCWRCSVRS
jgi:hypothetical protein